MKSFPSSASAKYLVAFVFPLALVCPAASAAPDLSNLIDILEAAPEGSWSKVGLNKFSDAWPDPADRALAGGSFSNPGSIIPAWSGFAWDSARGDMLLFGGGHQNYAGNEVYRWQGSTQTWQRASLPSQAVNVGGAVFLAADGALNAPPSAHTYDTTNYLPVADRMLVLGGAAFNTGGGFAAPDGAGGFVGTGPYLWDPSKADGNKVGGTTGSAPNPAVEGGQMWENRLNAAYRLRSVVDGTSATAVENGVDVVYFTSPSGGSTDADLYRYTIHDVNDPSKDTVEKVGQWIRQAYARGGAGYDPVSRLYVGAGSDQYPFVVWDLDSAGAFNENQTVAPTIVGPGTFVGGSTWSLDWDPVRDKFVMWSGGGDVWALDAPDAGTIAGQWTLSRWTDGDAFASGTLPPEVIQNRVLGKWKYASNLDAFIALEGAVDGNVWLYKPMGWINPVPEPQISALFAVGALILVFAYRGKFRPAC